MNNSEDLNFEKLITIYNSLPSIIYVSDPETYEIVFANRKAKELFGEDMEGTICYKTLQGLDSQCEFCTNPILLKNPSKPHKWEFNNPISKGSYSITDLLIDWPDGRKLRLEIADDISDRVEIEKRLITSEERFNLALSAAEEGIWDWHISSNEVYYSSQWKAQIGYKDDELKNEFQTWQNNLHPDDFEKTHEELNHYLQNPKGKFVVEFRFRHKDGSYRWIRNQASTSLDEGGNAIRMFGAHSDITLLKEQSELLKNEKQKAEQNDMFKSAFLANMSHDLRTPLNSIIGFSELIEMTEDKEERLHFIDIVKQNGQILLNLVNDIIDISRIEAGKLKLFKTEFSLDHFIQRIDDIYQERVSKMEQHKNLELKITTPLVPVETTLYTDEARLFQIFSNLINNSLKFTDSGHIHYGYRIHGGIIDFFVKDTGIGIAKDQFEQIFNRFGQVHDTISRNMQGTGLGLSICKQLTEILGGKIKIESKLEEGTSIYFSFPKEKLM